ncbi:MAG: phenylacetate--CoA ligase family protein [Nitrospiraceae bacterium]|nr:MAG: phenylacetate--CoA ligase family protein [Nitrospiraceae bacterium]
MKISRAYYSMPVALQNAAFSLYGCYMRKKRYNEAYEKACAVLRENELLSVDEHKERQLTALKKMLEHCAKNVPYYQKLFRRTGFDPETFRSEEDLRNIPVLEKRDVLKNPGEFVATNFRKSDLVAEETSGTSGSPLKVYWHKDFYNWIYALYETRMRGSAGVSISDRRANLTGKVLIRADQKKPPFWRYNLAEKQMYMSSYHLSPANIPFYVEALKKFRPGYIIGYPGSIHPVAEYLASSNDKVPSVKSVISCSEYLLPETRARIEKGFGCKVYNHYGSVEWVAALNECEKGNLHVSPEFGVIEILDAVGGPVPAGQAGEMICTGLLNYAMPFIRYRTGDIGSLNEGSCSCGRTLPLFKTLEGRKMSFLSLPDGRLAGSAALSTAFHAENIIESQMVQEKADAVTLKLVITDKFTDNDREYLVSELEKRVAPLRIDCERVDFIPCEKNGKKPWIINRLTAL